MSARHRKPSTVSNIAQFGADMSAIRELINRHAVQLYTGVPRGCPDAFKEHAWREISS